MNFSAVPRESFAGRILRAPLRLIPSETVLPVLQGPMRGARWIAGSHNHGCWLGSYEADKQHVLPAIVRPGQTVYDIGANAGFYTILMSRLVGPAGTVVSFEPLPRNIAYLRRHIELNNCANVTVVEAAVADKPSVSWFRTTESPTNSHLDSSGDQRVEVVALDCLELPPPSAMKVDIEGAEYLFLQGAARLIQHHRPTLLLATHTPELRHLCREFLSARGYRISNLASEDELLAVPA